MMFYEKIGPPWLHVIVFPNLNSKVTYQLFLNTKS